MKKNDKFSPQIGDLVNMPDFCRKFNIEYLGSLFIGIGDNVKFASTEEDISQYPIQLKWFCNGQYKVIKTKKDNTNPYPKYSYNSGLVNSDGSAVYGMDIDYMFYEVEHGRLPKPPEE